MGKWSSIAADYPTLPPDAAYGDKLVAAIAALDGLDVTALARTYDERHARKADLEAELKTATLALEAASRALLAQMEVTDLDSLKSGGFGYTRSPEPYPVTEDRDALRAWAVAEMPDNLALPFQTLRAVTKQKLEDGDAPPPGVGVFIKWSVSRRKSS